MRSEGVSFRHAVELLRDGIAPSQIGAGERKMAKASTVTKLRSPLDRTADDRELLGRVVGFYEQTLKESPEAFGYLERRGLRHPELLERFRLGSRIGRWGTGCRRRTVRRARMSAGGCSASA